MQNLSNLARPQALFKFFWAEVLHVFPYSSSLQYATMIEGTYTYKFYLLSLLLRINLDLLGRT